MHFGKRLKALRESYNMTQATLSQHLRVTRQAIGNYEQGTRFPKDEFILVAIADLFDVSLDYLLGRKNMIDSPVDIIYEKQNDYDTDKDRALKELFLSLEDLPAETIFKINDAIRSIRNIK